MDPCGTLAIISDHELDLLLTFILWKQPKSNFPFVLKQLVEDHML